jgi:hypothetical protein
MDRYGNPSAGVYEAYRYRKQQLELYGTVAIPPTEQGLVEHKPVLANPHKPKTPAAVAPVTGATGTSGATGATGTTGKKGKTKRKRSH